MSQMQKDKFPFVLHTCDKNKDGVHLSIHYYKGVFRPKAMNAMNGTRFHTNLM